MNPSSDGFWLLIGLLLALLMRPLRSFLTQDDAVYAFQAFNFAEGIFRFPTDAMAAVLPQTYLGSWLLRCFGSESTSVAPLNALTWSVFMVIPLVLKRWLGLKPLQILALLSVPYWLQYACGYLYDLYAFLLSALSFWVCDRALKIKRTRLDYAAAFLVLSAFSGMQLQTLLAVQAFLGLVFLLQRRWIYAVSIALGALLALGTLSVFPKSLWQQAQSYFLLQPRSVDFVLRAGIVGFQVLLGLGFFFIPFTRFSLKTLGAHAAVFLFLYVVNAPILAAGVFFSDYLPRFAAVFLASAGVWGWGFILSGRSRREPLENRLVWVWVLSLAFLYGYRGVNDMRYAMLLVPFVLWRKQERLAKFKPSIVWVVFLCGVSVFLNSYLVDTTEARWRAANALEGTGIDARRISAGYGRDHFRLEDFCVRRAYQKLQEPSFDDAAFHQRIYSRVPRVYEDEWAPEYWIKPSRIFGFPLKLRFNAQPDGAESFSRQTFQYRQLGIFKHELTISKSTAAQDAWCFR